MKGLFTKQRTREELAHRKSSTYLKKSLASSLWHSTDKHIYEKKLPLIEGGKKSTVSSKPHYS